ncbi:MAG: phosphotransferase family protein [Proteobacteria bacterium]|nr:phosphotransferase family protein [Pseudomonadota bacterium]
MSDPQNAMGAERLGSYLRTKVDGASDLVVEKLHRNIGGMSRETWFADATWSGPKGKETKTFTIRLDHPEGSVIPTPLEFEFKVYAALADTDVPVARALWFEPSTEWLGRSFYVRETIEGSSAPKALFGKGQEELRRSIGRQFARLLARIHLLDWEKAGFPAFMPVPTNPEDAARLELARWRKNFEDHRIEARPVATELYSWLNRNAPQDVPRVSLVWGDVGLGNFIFRGESVVGLTDWEQAHLGDPMKDWASALYRGVDNLLPREELFAEWEKESGLKIDRDRIHYYGVFIDAQYVSISHPMIRRIVELDGKIDISLVRLGMGFPFHCQHHGLEMLGV